ncbi:MAG: leucine-rich repeat domain-containing protein [Clostridia bacterium]|nr:leucine-rich repeat domain-containing protein [Clostridia bacterium]
MKKLFAMLLALLMIASLAACSDEGGDDSDLDDFRQEEVIIDHITNDAGETFYFDSVDSVSVTITGYKGSDVPHKVVIPSELNGKTVVGISAQAFYTCSNVTSVEFPSTLTTIEEFAFSGCAMIESLTIPASVTTIGTGAFYNCTGLKTLTFAAGSKLAELPASAFKDCTALEEVSIPAGIKVIGTAAFFHCTSLTKVTIAEGVEMLGTQAFQDCAALETLSLPASLVSIGSYNFTGCDKLTLAGVTVPAGSVAATYIDSLSLPAQPVETPAA